MEKVRLGFLAVLCVCICLLFSGWSGAQESAGSLNNDQQIRCGQMLAQAWEEYGFQNWEKAKNIFLMVISEKGASAKQALQARIGLTMVKEYRAPGRQPEDAIKDYEVILEEIGDLHESRPFILFNIGYAYITSEDADYDKARDYYQKSLDLVRDKKSFLGQQIILRYLASYLMRPNRAQFEAGIAKSAELLPLIKGGDCEGIAHGLVAALAGCVDNYPLEVKHLALQYEDGIKNRSILIGALFKLASINDHILKNYPEAIKYYEALAKDVPTASQGYYATLRAAELKKGIYESRIVGSKSFEYLGIKDGDVVQKSAAVAAPGVVKKDSIKPQTDKAQQPAAKSGE